MGKFEETVETYLVEMKRLEIKADKALFTKVAKGLGPSLYRADAAKVSSSDKSELERVKKNFLIKKLGLADTPKLDEGISDVVAKFGKGNRNKYRAIFYYLLVKRFRKSGVYKD